MDDFLNNIDEKKLDRIINSAMGEFTRFPYEKASTNSIVKNAGISKGLLFHYFGSKQKLYDYTISFAVNKLYREITGKIDYEENDLFERIKHIVILKFKLAGEYPQLFDFLISVLNNQKAGGSLKSSVEFFKNLGLNVEDAFVKIYYHNIDFGKFKDVQHKDEVINIIRWTLEKFSDQVLQNLGDSMNSSQMNNFREQIDVYISVLRKAFYKTGR